LLPAGIRYNRNKEDCNQTGASLRKRYYLWIVVALIVMSSVLPGCTGQKQVTSSNTFIVQDVTSQTAFDLIQKNKSNPDFVILDVRTASEFFSGHIEGALNIDVNLTSFREEVGKLNKNSTCLVYCRTGNRSKSAIRIMQESGFTHIYHLVNGITEWIAAGLPVS
jgi:rhodanese-related sulfurtransferase